MQACLLLVAASTTAPDLSLLVDGETTVRRFLDTPVMMNSYANILENVMQPAVVLLEESAGISDPDPMKVSLHGDSWTWNR